MIRVLIADDSAFMRNVLTDLFNQQPDFEVAIEKVKQLKPDILTLDVNMPVMDGLQALAIIMEENPLPVVMFSSLTQRGTDATIRALALGAVDFISKAGGAISKIEPVQDEILAKCRAAAQARVRRTIAASDSKPLTYTPRPLMPTSTEPPKMKRIEVQRRTGLKLGQKPTVKIIPVAPVPPPPVRGSATTGGRRADLKRCNR